MVSDELKKEFDERFGPTGISLTGHCTWTKQPGIFDERQRTRCHETGMGEIEPKQEAALEELGFELPNPKEKKKIKDNNRKVVFLILPAGQCSWISVNVMDCQKYEEPSYGGEAVSGETGLYPNEAVELARQSNHVKNQMKRLSSHRKKKIEQQEKEFKENFISDSDRILSQGELIEEQRGTATAYPPY